jgi:hypothetical protein
MIQAGARLISEYISERQTPLIANHAYGQFAFFDEADQQGTRDIEQISHLLRRDFNVSRRHAQGAPLPISVNNWSNFTAAS